MESAIDEKMNLMNKMAQALAKQENITPVQALARIKDEFMDREETTEKIRNLTRPDNGQRVAPEDAYLYASERTKVQMKQIEFQAKQLEMEQRRLDAELRKQELLERKLELEEKRHQDELKFQREKAEAELKYQREKDEADRKDQRERNKEDARIREQTAATERQIFLSNLSGGGKKGDETLEFLKLQSQSTSEYYKAQGEAQRGLYETLLTAKNSERDKEYEWKKELAKIEADREVEMAKLRAEDPKAASSIEYLVEVLGEKFEDLGKKLSTNPTNDFLAQIDAHNKFQEGLIKAAMPIFKAQGLSEDQLEKIKTQVGMEEKRQEGTLDKLWGIGKQIYKDYIVPATEKATQQMDAAPSGFENKIDPEIERRIRAETEAKARQLADENYLLQQQLEEEKKRIQQLHQERAALESRATSLNILFDPSVTNEQLFYAIEQQEALNEQNEQNRIEEQRRIDIENQNRIEEQRRIEEKLRVDEASHEVIDKASHEVFVDPNAAQATSQEVEAGKLSVEQDDQVREWLGPHIVEKQQEPNLDIQEELAIPRDVSPETQEFIDNREKQIQETKTTKTKKADKTKKTKGAHTFKVSDGEKTLEIDASNHKGAALKVTNKFNGTEENPVRLTVTSESGEERKYDTFTEERESTKGKKFTAPRLKAVKAGAG